MNILWITNIMLPPICESLGKPIPNVGGWMYSSLKRLSNVCEYRLAVATVYRGSKLISREIDGIIYYLLPLKNKSINKYNTHLEVFWKIVYESFMPDVIHIHGTEFPHGLAYVRACGKENVCVSIQGLISICSRYYTLPRNKNTRFLWTCRDLIQGNIKAVQRQLEKRGDNEKELLKTVHHIIGRTEWDKSHVWAINPDAHYYHVGETLRDSFYTHKWVYDRCEPYTIFISQSSSPIKGFHKVLEALPIVLQHFPNTKVFVAGNDPTKPWYRVTAYGKYLNRLIKKYHLHNHIFFTGTLNEREMCERYLRSNLFICCSAIENSPNSLGEAQLLGLPHLAAFVGGVPEIVNMSRDVLYRFEETEMLAKKICDIFNQKEKITEVYFNKEMYDENINLRNLLDVYNSIIR